MAENEEVLQRQVSAAYESLPEIAARRRTLRWLRIAVPVVAVVMVLVGLYVLASSAHNNVVTRKEELSTEFQKRASQMNLAERVQREAEQTVDRVLPKLQQEMDAAQAKLAAQAPKTLEIETAAMEGRVKKYINNSIDSSLGEVKKRQREFLLAEFGDYLKCKETDTRDVCNAKEAQVDALMNELTDVFREWAVDQMTGTFNAHLKVLGDIHTTVAAYSRQGAAAGDAASKSAASGNAPSDMLMLFVEAAADSLGAGDAAFDDGGPQIIEQGAGDSMAEEGIIDRATPSGGGSAPTPEGGSAPEGGAAAPEGGAAAPEGGSAPAPEGGAAAPEGGSAPAPEGGAAAPEGGAAAPAPADPEAPKAP